MFQIHFAILLLTWNVYQTAAECTHENNFGVYFIYCQHLNSLDEIDTDQYGTSSIRVFIKNSTVPFKRSKTFKGTFLKELRISESNVPVVEASFLDGLQEMGSFAIENSRVETIDSFPKLERLHYLQITDSEFAHFPQDLTQNLSGLYAATFKKIVSDLRNLSIDMLKNSPVQYLSLDNVGLEMLSPDCLHTLKRLESLSLSSNTIAELPSHLFKDLKSLQDLNLSGNKLTDLNRDTFVGLRKLKDLNLSNNDFEHVDASWFKELFSVDFIDLHSNKIKNVDITAPTLKTLDLSGNVLTELKNEVFTGVPHLNSLDLSSNAIAVIEADAFRDLYGLLVLNLEGNQISTLNSDVFKYSSNLATLKLSGNKITDLNAVEFKKLENLLSLNLSHNRIENFPKNVFQELYSLEELDLHNTDLTHVDEDMFHGLENLKKLNLSENQLKIINSSMFNHLTGLVTLNLANVGLNSLNADAFSTLPNLKVLDLEYNALGDLPEDIFKHSQFTFISLRGNQVRRLNPDVFSNQIEMEEFDLRSTPVDSLSMVERMPNLRYLLLKDTQFEDQQVIFFENSTFRRINDDYWDSWCPDFIIECRRN